MKILELFAGSKSFASAAAGLGHTTYTSDSDDEFDCDYTVDILEFDTKVLPWLPDIVWASPPCESFSVASIGHHWHSPGNPKTDGALHGLMMLDRTLELITELKPKYYFIENPRGMMRKMPQMQGHVYRHTVSYCQYGDTRMKPTDIWTDCPYWKPRPICKNGAPCHVAAPRGSRTGTQGIATYFDRSRVPEELCLEILAAIQGGKLVQPDKQLMLELI
jgi:hypothetical protein